MFRFKSSNDPDYPGEKTLGVKDVVLLLCVTLIVLSGIVSVYSIIWAAWLALRVSATILVTACIALVLCLLIPSEEGKED